MRSIVKIHEVKYKKTRLWTSIKLRSDYRYPKTGVSAAPQKGLLSSKTIKKRRRSD